MPEWSETTAQVLKSHGVSEKSGLSASQVARLTAEHGKNELAQEEATPLWKLVLAQFDDLLVKILLGAAVLSFVLACFEEGEGVEAFVEPFVILLILVINAVVGVWQEHNAESALEALKQMQSATAKCIRGGELVPDLPAEELVPGDIVEIGVGDKVPADVRILRLKTTTVRTDEGALTGESETVMKQTEPVAKSVRIQAKLYMMFAGTTVSNGAAVGVVTATGMRTEIRTPHLLSPALLVASTFLPPPFPAAGMRTEIGKIQANVQEAKEDEEKTPLGQKIDAFGELLARVIAGICVLVWVMNIQKFADPVRGGFWHEPGRRPHHGHKPLLPLLPRTYPCPHFLFRCTAASGTA